MRDLLALFIYLIVAITRLMGSGGARALVAENLLLKQQMLVLNRARKRTPRLTVVDRFLFGALSLSLTPRRILQAAIVLKPSTLFRFHAALVKRKYHLLYSSRRCGNPGPKGPSKELIQAIVQIKRRNPRFGCPRIAQQITYTFGIVIDKDVVRRVLDKHYYPDPNRGDGPSWLTLLGFKVGFCPNTYRESGCLNIRKRGY